jgi:hypothetical protein
LFVVSVAAFSAGLQPAKTPATARAISDLYIKRGSLLFCLLPEYSVPFT